MWTGSANPGENLFLKIYKVDGTDTQRIYAALS